MCYIIHDPTNQNKAGLLLPAPTPTPVQVFKALAAPSTESRPAYCYPTPSGSQWGRGRELNSVLPTAGALNAVSQGTGSMMPGWSKTVVTIHRVVH